jgi:hypothetical protein
MQICLLLDDPSRAELLEKLHRNSLKEIRARSSHFQSAFIYFGALFGHWKWFEDMEFVIATSSPSIADMFTGRQTDGNWMNSAQCCPQAVQYSHVILCYIKLLRNIIDRLGTSVCEFLLSPFVVAKGRCSVWMLLLSCRRLGYAHKSWTSAGRRSGGGIGMECSANEM